MRAAARNRKQNKTREFVIWARIFNTKPELNDFRDICVECRRQARSPCNMFWAPLCDSKSESRDFRGTGTPKIVQLGLGIAIPGPSDKLTSLVLFSVPCRSPQRRPSVRRTLGTKKSLALRAEFLGGAWSAPRGLARAPPNGHRCRRRSHEQVIVSARALENPKRFAPDACQ